MAVLNSKNKHTENKTDKNKTSIVSQTMPEKKQQFFLALEPVDRFIVKWNVHYCFYAIVVDVCNKDLSLKK